MHLRYVGLRRVEARFRTFVHVILVCIACATGEWNTSLHTSYLITSFTHQFPHWPWPAGTQWGAFLFLLRTIHSLSIPELSQDQVRNYVRSYASYLNINSNDENLAAVYNTRVERVEKRSNKAGQEQGWRLWLRSLEPTQNHTYRVTWWTEVRITPLARLGCILHLIHGRICRILMLSPSLWAGTMHHRCRPFPV